MKYSWESNDIICGRIVCSNPDKDRFDASQTANRTYKIGFVNGGGKSNLVLIAMTDGMVSGPKTTQQLVDHLNTEDYMPMPHRWWVEVINYLRDCYEFKHI